MQCEVRHLRLTDGHAWINIIHETATYNPSTKPNMNIPAKDLDINMTTEQVMERYNIKRGLATNWLVKIGGKHTKGAKAWEVYCKNYNIEDVMQAFEISKEVARGRVANHCTRHGITMPKQDMTQRVLEMARAGASVGHIAQSVCRSGHIIRSIVQKESEKTGEKFACLLDIKKKS